MAIKIYSTPTCAYCKMAKAFLKELKLDFEDIDVSANAKAAEEMTEKTGQMAVPVIDINGIIIQGFDREAITTALRS